MKAPNYFKTIIVLGIMVMHVSGLDKMNSFENAHPDKITVVQVSDAGDIDIDNNVTEDLQPNANIDSEIETEEKQILDNKDSSKLIEISNVEKKVSAHDHRKLQDDLHKAKQAKTEAAMLKDILAMADANHADAKKLENVETRRDLDLPRPGDWAEYQNWGGSYYYSYYTWKTMKRKRKKLQARKDKKCACSGHENKKKRGGTCASYGNSLNWCYVDGLSTDCKANYDIQVSTNKVLADKQVKWSYKICNCNCKSPAHIRGKNQHRGCDVETPCNTLNGFKNTYPFLWCKNTRKETQTNCVSCIDDNSADAFRSDYSCMQLSRHEWCDDDATYANQTQNRCPLTCGKCNVNFNCRCNGQKNYFGNGGSCASEDSSGNWCYVNGYYPDCHANYNITESGSRHYSYEICNCHCTGQTNDFGNGGSCASKDDGGRWCYVDNTSPDCIDNYNITKSGNRYYSYEICKRTSFEPTH